MAGGRRLPHVATVAGRRALRWSNAVQPALVAVAAVAVAGYVAVVDPNQAGHYPTCPFLALTGHYCPGCGSLRAIHALAHGDLARAVGLNLLMVAMVPLLVTIWGRWLVTEMTGRPRPRPAPAWRIWALLGVICVFWLVRNLPVGAALAP